MPATTRRALVMAAALAAVSTPALADAATVPTGDAASAARFEAEAFAAIEEKRDCDAAIAFTQAYALSAKDRLIFNAGMAYERHGDYVRALSAFERVTDEALLAQASAHTAAIVDKQRTSPGSEQHCPSSLSTSKSVTPAPGAAPSSSLLPWSIAAFASGVAIAGTSVAGFAYGQAILDDPRSSGDAKGTALATSTPVLVIGSSLGGLLCATGAVLLAIPMFAEPS
jgi:hypothetical protein